MLSAFYVVFTRNVYLKNAFLTVFILIIDAEKRFFPFIFSRKKSTPFFVVLRARNGQTFYDGH